jgi:hypothetical protein
VNEVLRVISSAFSWTFPAPNSVVTLVLGAILGQIARIVFTSIGRRVRSRPLIIDSVFTTSVVLDPVEGAPPLVQIDHDFLTVG